MLSTKPSPSPLIRNEVTETALPESMLHESGRQTSLAVLRYLLPQGAQTSSGLAQYASYVLPVHAWREHAWLQRAGVIARVSLTVTAYASKILTCSVARTAASNSAGFSGLAIERKSVVPILISEVDNVLRLDAHSRPVHSNGRLELGASISVAAGRIRT